MRAAEKNLLIAVRDRLRSVNDWTDEQCQVEHDEVAPAVAGNLYVVVMTGGWTPGPRHRTSGGVSDLIYSVDVSVAKRVANVPKDRLRNVFLHNLDSLDEELDKVYRVVDWGGEPDEDGDYPLMRLANALILEETGSEQGFVEPLKFSSIERRPRIVGGELFSAKSGQPQVGMVRTMSFTGARRITHK